MMSRRGSDATTTDGNEAFAPTIGGAFTTALVACDFAAAP